MVPTCFVIMPISMPDELAAKYGGDNQHFLHILEHLFEPALKKAKLDVLRPVMTGDANIQAQIIQNLESADYVLCDMSTLNPNVFFELGVRTALNRPAILVRDDLTPRAPFDTNTINHHEYVHQLRPWNVTVQIDQLTEHIESTVSRGDQQNSLWRYFGLTRTGEPTADASQRSTDERLDFLTEQVASISRSLLPPGSARSRLSNPALEPARLFLEEVVRAEAGLYGATIRSATVDVDRLEVEFSDPPPPPVLDYIARAAEERGIGFIWRYRDRGEPRAGRERHPS